MIGVSFYVIAAYVGVEALRQLLGGSHPEVSWIGIALAVLTLAIMPPLAVAEVQGGRATPLGRDPGRGAAEHALRLSVGSAAGRTRANALAGWWWADPITALLIAGVAVREGRESWRGEACCEVC